MEENYTKLLNIYSNHVQSELNPLRVYLQKFDLSGFIYIVVTALILHCFKIPEIMASMVVLPAFLILPYLFGKIVIKSSKVFFKGLVELNFSDMPTMFVFSWLVGSHSVATLLLILTFLHLPLFVKILPFVLLLIIAIDLIYGWKKRALIVEGSFSINVSLFSSEMFVIIISFFTILITKVFVPFPQIWGYTYFMLPFNIQYAYRATENGYFAGGRYADWLYTALIYCVFGLNPLYFMWSAPFIIMIFYALGIFTLSVKLSKDIKIGVMSAVFSVFINFTEIWPSQFMHLKSNIIMYSTFPLVLLHFYNEAKMKSYETKKMITTLLFSFISIMIISTVMRQLASFLYNPEGMLFLETFINPIMMTILPIIGIIISRLLKSRLYQGLYLLYVIYYIIFYFMHADESYLYALVILAFIIFIGNLTKNKFRIFVLFLASSALLFVYLQWVNILCLYSTNPVSSLFYPSLKYEHPVNMTVMKVQWFKEACPEPLPYLLILGTIFSLFSEKNENLLMVSMLSLVLSILFFPDFMTYRAFSQLSPFISYIISLGFLQIVLFGQNFLKWIARAKNIIFILLVIIMIISTFPPLVYHVYEESHLFRISSLVSVADYEYRAALWLKDNLPERVAVISDYMTIQILSSIGNKIWLPGRAMDVISLDNSSRALMERIKYNIFKANSSEQAYNNILPLYNLMHAQDRQYLKYLGIEKDTISFVVILSSRTDKWISEEGIGDVLSARYSKISVDLLKIFDNPRYFKLIYKDVDEYLYIFEVIKNEY